MTELKCGACGADDAGPGHQIFAFVIDTHLCAKCYSIYNEARGQAAESILRQLVELKGAAASLVTVRLVGK